MKGFHPILLFSDNYLETAFILPYFDLYTNSHHLRYRHQYGILIYISIFQLLLEAVYFLSS